MLESLGQNNTLLWICMGDFNEMLYADETIGGNSKLEQQMDQFRMALNHYFLRDLGFLGPWFTWFLLACLVSFLMPNCIILQNLPLTTAF